MCAEPLSGFRQATARLRRTKADWARDVAAMDDWHERNKDNPMVNRRIHLSGGQTRLQEELERKYFSEEMLQKYSNP